jgi:hypothetical protein
VLSTLLSEVVRCMHQDAILLLRSKRSKSSVNEIAATQELIYKGSMCYSSSVLKYDFINLYVFNL